MLRTYAFINSLKNTMPPGQNMALVTIVKNDSNNNAIARYKGKYYSAVYNPFVGMFYVDDLYGLVPKPHSRLI
jgi:hypothetical protein